MSETNTGANPSGSNAPNSPQSPIRSGFKWLGSAAKAIGRWIWERVPTRTGVSRGLKYAVLLLALAVNSKVVFDGFSYYLARRNLDTELEKKNPAPSIELLGVLSKRERAFVIDTLQTRCLERDQLALFRTWDAVLQPKLREAHLKSQELRSGVILAIKAIEAAHPDWSGVVDITALKNEFLKVGSTISLIRGLVKPAGGVKEDDANYQTVSKAVIDTIEKEIEPARVKLAEYEQVRKDVVAKLGRESPDFGNIKLLEERLDRLNLARKQNGEKLKDLEDLRARYAVWTEALTGGAEDNPVLDEMAFQLTDNDRRNLQQVDCDRFEKYFQKVTGRAEHFIEGPPAKGVWATFARLWSDVLTAYRDQMLGFLNSPPVGQTLFVTLFLGSLGALAINALRLSKIGWWQPQPDPLWGELLLSPLLGALGAFGIFLLGSAGLLLSGDAKTSAGGATALSPFFIGVLGFISGLLYDEAFGRVRRFGAQIFAGDTPTILNTPEDQSLAQELRNANASAVADLVLKFGIGKRIAEEEEFTLLIPSDDAMGRLTLAAWKDISEARTRPKFEDWLRRHHALKRVAKADVAKEPLDIEVEDGRKYPAAVTEDVLKVNGVSVAKADINWKNGVIHVLDGDVPEA